MYRLTPHLISDRPSSRVSSRRRSVWCGHRVNNMAWLEKTQVIANWQGGRIGPHLTPSGEWSTYWYQEGLKFGRKQLGGRCLALQIDSAEMMDVALGGIFLPISTGTSGQWDFRRK